MLGPKRRNLWPEPGTNWIAVLKTLALILAGDATANIVSPAVYEMLNSYLCGLREKAFQAIEDLLRRY